MKENEVTETLRNYNTLNARLLDLGIDEVEVLIEAESAGRRRPYMLKRLAARYGRLRGEAERRRVLDGLTGHTRRG